MTPLAYRIVKDLTLPMKHRRMTHLEPELLAHFREEFHCFEVSAIHGRDPPHDLAKDLKHQMLESGLPSISGAFLPAERTWLEWSAPDAKMPRGRVGAMLVRRRDGFADVFVINNEEWSHQRSVANKTVPSQRLGRIALSDELAKIAVTFNPERPFETEKHYVQLAVHDPKPDHIAYGFAWEIYALLLLINTPHVTSRAQRDPHRALAREVLAHRKMLGIFPLQAWTQITLKPGAIDDSEEQDDTITGSTRTVPLHWTRSHQRRIHGVWTLIRDYWSGDGSVGLKQSRYRVVPPEPQSPKGVGA